MYIVFLFLVLLPTHFLRAMTNVPLTPCTPRAHPLKASQSSVKKAAAIPTMSTQLQEKEQFADVVNKTYFETLDTIGHQHTQEPILKLVVAKNAFQHGCTSSTIYSGNPLLIAAFDSTGKCIKITRSLGNQKTLLYINSNFKTTLLEHEQPVTRVQLSNDATRLLSTTQNYLYLWDLTTAKILNQWISSTTKCQLSASFGAKDSCIIIADSDSFIQVFKIAPLELLSTYTISGNPQALQIEDISFGTPYERLLGYEKRKELNHTRIKTITAPLYFYITKSNSFTDLKQPFSGEPHTGSIIAIKISPNGKFLATCSKDETTKLWSITEKLPGHTLLHTFKAYSAPIAIAFSNTRNLLAIGYADNTIYLHEIETGQCTLVLSSSETNYFKASLLGIHFNSDDTILLSYNYKAIIEWNIQSLKD